MPADPTIIDAKRRSSKPMSRSAKSIPTKLSRFSMMKPVVYEAWL